MSTPSPQLTRVLDALRARGKKVIGSGGQWKAQCPAHTDDTPSLSISDGRSGVVLWCFAGCDCRSIIGAIGLEAHELFYRRLSSRNGLLGDPVASYWYPAGIAKIRFEKTTAAGKKAKTFRWSVNGIMGQNVLKGRSSHDLLFGEELLSEKPDSPVWVTEGEKGCLALRALLKREGVSGVVVAGGGAAGWRPTRRVLALFSGCDVIPWPDADEKGRAWGRHFCSVLDGVAATVRAVVIPNTPEHADPADWTGSYSDLMKCVGGPDAIPPEAATPKASLPEGKPRYASIRRDRGAADDVLRTLTDLQERIYFRLVRHRDGGIVRAFKVSAEELAASIRLNPNPRFIGHVRRVLAALEAVSLIVQFRETGYVYLVNGGRFLPPSGSATTHAQKYLMTLPENVRRVVLLDEPELASLSSREASPNGNGTEVSLDPSFITSDGYVSRYVGGDGSDENSGNGKNATTPGNSMTEVHGGCHTAMVGKHGGMHGGMSPEHVGAALDHAGVAPEHAGVDDGACPTCGRDSCPGDCEDSNE